MKWQTVKLHDICRPKQWPTIPMSVLKENGYPVYGANGRIGFYDKYTHENPTLLITCRGATCGTINVCEPYSYVTGNSMALDDLDEARANQNFLCHYLKKRRLDDVISGSAQPQITREGLRAVEIPLPPIAQQKRIAAILDKAEELRSLRRQALAQLNAMTQSIFLEMFGDPAINPKGWDIFKVSDYVSTFQGGKNIDPEDEKTVTRNRVVKVSSVTSMIFRPEESKPLPDSYEPPEDHFIKPGDLLFSRANTTELVGAVAYVQSTPKNITLADKVWRFVWKEPLKVDSIFIWFLFQTPAMRYEIGRRATGTSGSMKNISQPKTLSIPTILPPLPLQQEFARRVEEIEQLKVTHRESLAHLDALFASLQHRAFRGEL
jgi:type I restriction enzyme S subunit